MSQYFAAMFRRRPNDGWFRVGRYDATTVDIMCALAIVSMFVYGLSIALWDNLLFSTILVREYEFWRLFTWPIATPPDIWPLLGIVFFWVFGQQLEGLFGRNKFVVWIVGVTVIPAVLSTLISMLSSDLNLDSFNFGLSTLFLGGIWVYAATYPGVRWFEVVPLWAVAAVFTVLNVLQYSGDAGRRTDHLPAARLRDGVVHGALARVGDRLADPAHPAEPVRGRASGVASDEAEVQARLDAIGSSKGRGSAARPRSRRGSWRHPPIRPSSTRCSTRSGRAGWTRCPAPRRSASTSSPNASATPDAHRRDVLPPDHRNDHRCGGHPAPVSFGDGGSAPDLTPRSTGPGGRR